MWIQVVLLLDGWKPTVIRLKSRVCNLFYVFRVLAESWWPWFNWVTRTTAKFPQSENYKTHIQKTHSRPHEERQTWILVRVNGKSKGRWSSTMEPLHWIHLWLIPAWNPHISHASTGKTTALRILFPLTKFETSKAQFPLTGSFWSPFGWSSSRGKLDQGGTSLGKAPHSSACRPNQPFAMHHAFCMMLLRWPEMRA